MCSVFIRHRCERHLLTQNHSLILRLQDIDSGLLGDVEPVEELPDVLVLHGGGLLDEGGGLGHGLDGITGHNELVLLVLGVLALDARGHAHAADELLAEEVTDLDEGAGLGDGAVDGEMGVHSAHLVLVTLKINMHR